MKRYISLLVILSILILNFGTAITFAEESTTTEETIEETTTESTSTEEVILEPIITEEATTTEDATTTDGNIDTFFTETGATGTEGVLGASQSTASPVIKALFAMQGLAVSLLGTDDGTELGTQFLPSGQYQVAKPVSICAVVYDADGSTDINSVLNKVYYPMASFDSDRQDGRTGCGQEMGQECQMTKLAKDDGYNLLCNAIQNNNSNLVSFYDIYNFDGLCGDTGELQVETAGVFCCDRDLAYDDIAGEYKISVFGEDSTGNMSNILGSGFSYLELTAYEADFDSLNYGNVSLNSRKILEGDLAWNEPKGENQATVRNVGNTRLQMTVVQNDMGLGKTDGIWNIRYGTKVGQESLWQNYWPEETTLLSKILNLSQSNQMDFAIEVLSFPTDDTQNYGGKMTLNGQKVDGLVCVAGN